MKKARILALILALIMLMSCTLTSCIKPPVENPDENSTPDTPTDKPEEEKVFDLPYAEGTLLRMATGYNSTKTGLSFHADIFPAGQSSITLSNGKTYNVGDLKPPWVEVENLLKIDFEDKFTGTSASDQFKYWQDRLDEVDMVSGTATQLTENGVAGKLVDIAQYLDHMPNFKAYLEANPIVRLSVTGDTETGAIYFSPYFDGVNDIERMPLMRTDWVEKLLNGEGDFTAEESKNLAAAVYAPYMPTTGSVTVDVVKADGTGTEKVTKNYAAAGNIIANMNAALSQGAVSGVEAVNMLRDYIDAAYGGYYGTNRADLFIGQNAAWDADELVALLRCVVANPQTLNGTDTVQGLFSREDNNNQRKVDMFRFAGTLFGVRGLESRQDYLYVGADGMLHDARQEEATYVAIERMNAMAKEGLISTAFVKNEAGKTQDYLKNDSGFMHYDYNQTQTVFNEKDLQKGEKYMAVLVPVARWNDGTGEIFRRFTESWRSVKTDGWGISAAGVEGNPDKLHAALAIIDFAYSPKGMILMSYGPDEFIKTKADGSYVTFKFNGQDMPVIADSTYEELWALEGGNYTNYARIYLGSTLSFAKSQAFEYQCTQAVGKEGAGRISTAIALGVIKHPELAITENPWWTSVPTVLPNTKDENTKINELLDLTSSGKFSQAKNKTNLLIDLICAGYEGSTMGASAAEAAAKVAAKVSDGGMGGETYLAYKNDAWDRLLEYYESLGK